MCCRCAVGGMIQSTCMLHIISTGKGVGCLANNSPWCSEGQQAALCRDLLCSSAAFAPSLESLLVRHGKTWWWKSYLFHLEIFVVVLLWQISSSNPSNPMEFVSGFEERNIQCWWWFLFCLVGWCHSMLECVGHDCITEYCKGIS